jgi:hypothetical protein
MTGVCELSRLGVSKNNQLCLSVCCIFCALVSVNTVYHIMVLMNGISLIVFCYLVVIDIGSVMMCFSVWTDDVFCCSERDALNLILLNQMPVILLFVCQELLMAPRSFLLFMASSYDAMFQKSLKYLLFQADLVPACVGIAMLSHRWKWGALWSFSVVITLTPSLVEECFYSFFVVGYQ